MDAARKTGVLEFGGFVTAQKDREFEGFCTGVYPRLRGYLALYCGDRDVALDLTQETLARAYRDWRKVRRAASPEGWVFRVATNLAHSHYRRKAIERRATARLRPDASVASTQDRDDVLDVHDALLHVPQRQREALLLRYYADLSVAAVAEQMSCPEGTAKSLISRGVAGLRDYLGHDLKEARNV